MNEFDPAENLEAFVNGTLNESQNRRVLDYLVSNDAALGEVDRLWGLRQDLTDLNQVPVLESEQANRMEVRLVNRLHRSELGGHTLWLATAGLMQTILALLLPLLSSASRRRSGPSQK